MSDSRHSFSKLNRCGILPAAALGTLPLGLPGMVAAGLDGDPLELRVGQYGFTRPVRSGQPIMERFG